MTLTPHAENIVTPHPTLAFDEEPQPLLAVIDPEGIKDQLQQVEQAREEPDADRSNETDEDGVDEVALSAMEFICSQVREALIYPVKEGERDDFSTFDVTTPVPLEALEDKQVADCFGFTIVASECIDAAEIDHWVGFANGHSVLLLPKNEDKGLHLVDPLSKVLGQNLEHSLASGATVAEDMHNYGRSAIELNTYSLVQRARGDDIGLLKEHPWLVFKRGGGPQDIRLADYVTRDGRHIELSNARLKILMSIFRPAEGRQVLQDYNAFQLAYNKGDYIGAAARIQGMRGSFPELDARKPHTEIRKIMTELGRSDRIAFARRVLDSYFESFVLVAGDSRFTVAHGDALRVLAREGGDLTAAEGAVNKYGEALDSKRFPRAYRETVSAKLAKALKLRDQLEARA